VSRFEASDRVRWLFHKHPPMYRVGVVVSVKPAVVEGPVDAIRLGVKTRVAQVEWDHLEKRHPNGIVTRTPCLDRYGFVPEADLMREDAVSALGDLV